MVHLDFLFTATENINRYNYFGKLAVSIRTEPTCTQKSIPRYADK